MNETSQELHKIARGTGIVFVGTVVSMFFGFLNRAVIARYFSVSEYGVFNLALTVLNVIFIIVTLGIPNALPREVAVYKKTEPSKVKVLVSTALIVVALSSLAGTIFLVLGAENISQVFSEGRLAYGLKIMSFALPFAAVTVNIVSSTQGFGRVRERVFFNIFYPLLLLIFVLSIALLNFPFISIFLAYTLAQSAIWFILFVEVKTRGIFEIGFYFDWRIGMELIKFSIPLMLTGIIGFVITWADTLMLGYYKSSNIVGLYNAATPLAQLLPVFLNSAAFLYLSSLSQLYVQRKIPEMKRIYQVLTKWIFLLTFPLFSVIFIFPEATINFLFGENYIPASLTLQILALGFMTHAFLGLNEWTLIAIGEPKLNLIGNSFAAIFNIILNALLIPRYGIVGAASATATSYTAANVIKSFWLYRRIKIHPFSRNCTKSLVIGFVLLGFVKSIHITVLTLRYAVLILLVFLGVYYILVYLSGSIDKEDTELFLMIKKRFRE
ncbi:polysaccharide biosynthesis protein [Thermococcus profundus]|uniref:Polysaccharide biosynthesis protein n=1 Tax=Thermococcus profundus TaxID=49899 RepID=A0A2Z2MFR4_THEPR|nr:flippase [Thermococcus profundus]ASJ03582.1 polysaccharide biosynthesis protein [Thermococcus profundus]